VFAAHEVSAAIMKWADPQKDRRQREETMTMKARVKLGFMAAAILLAMGKTNPNKAVSSTASLG
jgi:hypothetical protein